VNCRVWMAGALLLGVVCGCRPAASPPAGPGPAPEVEPGSRADAALTLPVRTETGGEQVVYLGDEWRLTVPRASGWRQEPEVRSTLRLMRQADDVTAALRLRVYAIRAGMDPRAFLAAHAMWLAEERAPRVEYQWDRDLQAWQGYSVGTSRETYYLFRLAGRRAYVLEESAEAGTLSSAAADEFQRIAADFECGPRPAEAP